MYAIDPRRTDLAAEFKAHPFGPHGAELAALVTALRMAPMAGKHVLLHHGSEWELARLSPARHAPPQRLGLVFRDLAEAEWAVFRQRWEAATGVPLDLP